MKRITLVIFSFFFIFNLGYSSPKKKKNKKDNKSEVEVSKYDQLLDSCEVQKGVLNILHNKKKDKYYLDIKKSIFSREFLLGSRVSEVSNNKDVLAGEQLRQPKVVRFELDHSNILLRIVNDRFITDDDKHIGVSLQRNYSDPIMEAFEITTTSKDSSSFIIDVTKFFCSDIKELSPFQQGGGLFGGKSASGSFKSKLSRILGAKAFETNISIKTRMAYEVKSSPYLTVMTRSLLLLPETPMKPRISDKRMGYFIKTKYLYTANKDELQKVKYINRWDLKAKPEDVEKHKAGELVEPEKQIVWYVDSAIPEKWRTYIKKGIEDWQQSFEEIGFKNAIVAKDYPTKEEDPNFDPDDIKYTCYRYVTTHVPNSKGPSWIDPRSGEIIQGDVLFYHNIIKILHQWQFVQTAAVDPSVRKETFDIETMGSSLRYVAAHEVGHTLGLKHNFGASYAFPVDSLRSATFTQKYGTTPSIMDYARYNYVAQPGDKGVRLSPPNMGVYDKFAIKWGYQPIYEASTPEEEYDTLNKWILDKKDNPMYWYGEQQILIENDPSCQSEALGDDAIKASIYGLKNLKIINDSLINWSKKTNKDYSQSEFLYNGIHDQVFRYIGHVTKYIGGVYLKNPVHGDGKKSYEFVPRKKQKEAVNFLFDQINDLPNWLTNKYLLEHTPFMDTGLLSGYMGEITVRILGTGALSRLKEFELQYPDEAYTQMELMNDIYDKIWEKTKSGKKLNHYDQVIQYEYVRFLLQKGIYPLRKKSTDAFAFCSCCASDVSAITDNKGSGSKITLNALYDYQLKKVYNLMKKNLRVNDELTRVHYLNIYDHLRRTFK